MKIFSKLNSNEYNNELEVLLENKTFDEKVKNLLLSMLYKIENGYNDYTKVNTNAKSKEAFMKKILYIIKEYCFEIEIVTPETPESKPLEQENKICKIDVDRGSILVYANEQDLLYSLIQMDILQKIYEYTAKNKLNLPENTYYQNAIKQFIIDSKCLNESEIIRDFDGWSWNNNIKSKHNIETNLMFQNILMSNTNIENIDFYNKNFEQSINTPEKFEGMLYKTILTLSAEKSENIKNEIYNQLNKQSEMLELMNNRKKFLNQITQEKKTISNEIKIIDEKLNDKEKLRVEYDIRNSKLPNKEKIFSVSFLADIMKKERSEKLETLKFKNKLLEPLEFVRQKEKIENECNFLQGVVCNLENQENKRKTIINTQIEFLKKLEQQIDKITEKEKLEKMLYQFRYYCLLPVRQNEYIKDVLELQEPIKKVMNVIIDNCIDKQILTNFSNSASLCYAILKHIFYSKIIDLKEVLIKISKTQKPVNGQFNIAISIYDVKDAEEKYNEIVDNLELLNVKLNKKISLFVK